LSFLFWLVAFLIFSKNLVLEKYTLFDLLKLNRWMMIGMASAKNPNKNSGYRNFIQDKSK